MNSNQQDPQQHLSLVVLSTEPGLYILVFDCFKDELQVLLILVTIDIFLDRLNDQNIPWSLYVFYVLFHSYLYLFIVCLFVCSKLTANTVQLLL